MLPLTVSALLSVCAEDSGSPLWAADGMAQQKGPGVGNFLTAAGRFNLEAARQSGYEGPVDLAGYSCRRLPGTGELHFQRTGTRQAVPDPEYAFWDNSMSPSIPGADNLVSAIAVYNSSLVIGGNFTLVGPTVAGQVAQWNGSDWSAMSTGMDGYGAVFALTIFDGKLIAGGSFTTAGGVTGNGVAAWTGSERSALGSGTNGGVRALAQLGDNLVEAGLFSTAGEKVAARIAHRTKPSCPIALPGDVNLDGQSTAADIIYVVNYVFKGGSPPCDVCSIL